MANRPAGSRPTAARPIAARPIAARPTVARPIAALLMVTLGSAAASAAPEAVYNSTGLPLYPNLIRGQMDGVSKTDALGHVCMRFAADTLDSLDAVEAWYRKALSGASETDLNHDERYRHFFKLSGIKLALGIDSVTVYRTADQPSTSIELFRCSPPRH